jgi:pyruvate/2-oxoglutarate dehydrogenase complex dihydrolipoamide dehydrogenase (E3) component
MPAFEEETEASMEENVKMHFLTAPKEIIVTNGKMSGLKCLKMRLGDIDESGRRRPEPIEDSEFIIELDTLIIATGEQPDVSFLDKDTGFILSKWNTIKVDPETFTTNVEGVFAGGDVATGPKTVIEAMGAGKVVSRLIDRYLQGQPIKREYRLTRPSTYVEPVELTEEEVMEAKRPSMACMSVPDRVCSFSEVELGLTEEEAVREARRCLRCDLETEEGKKLFEKR